ncbi:MAG: hypothetical protein PHV59_04250 [Victivallales bacterium]|nr:hypothetical protein [Victivallales bacterium]
MTPLKRQRNTDVITRWKGNPIISVEDLWCSCSHICNAAAVKFRNDYLLLVTIEDMRGIKRLHLSRSPDPYDFEVDCNPFIAGSQTGNFARYEQYGVLDPKITRIGDIHYITYTALSQYGFRLALAETEDFKSVRKRGFISEPDSKGGMLFPEKIRGKYVKLEMPKDGKQIWISYSDDLVFWGGYDQIMAPRGGFWDAYKVGPAVPPMRVADGRWLLLYYGVKSTSGGPITRIGAAFLDADDPAKVVARTNIPIISPRTQHERVGDIFNVVSTCGGILEGDRLLLYYGAANSCICAGMTTVQEIEDDCLASEKEF